MLKPQLLGLITLLITLTLQKMMFPSLRIKLRSLGDLQRKYDAIQSELEISEETIADLENDRIQVENDLCNAECKLHNLLDKFSANPTDNANTTPNEFKTERLVHPIQLKPIKLPDFSRNVLEWQHYTHMFNDLVDSRVDLTNIQKLHYLHTSLKGEALEIIKNLPITNENYYVALDLLKNRFDNKLIISLHHVENILKINSIDKESANNISNFINKINSTVNALKVMHLPVNIFELIVTQFLTSKLDQTTSKCWKETLSSENFPDFDNLLNF